MQGTSILLAQSTRLDCLSQFQTQVSDDWALVWSEIMGGYIIPDTMVEIGA